MATPETPTNREELIELIAGALKRSVTFLDDQHARGAADTILRELKAAGVTMRGRKVTQRKP